MEAASSTLSRAAPMELGRKVDWSAVSTWALGFGLVIYLGLKGGARPSRPRPGRDSGLVGPACRGAGRRAPQATARGPRLGLARPAWRLRRLDGAQPHMDRERRADLRRNRAGRLLSRRLRPRPLRPRRQGGPPHGRRSRHRNCLHRDRRPALAPASVVVPSGDTDGEVSPHGPRTSPLPARLLERARRADGNRPTSIAPSRDLRQVHFAPRAGRRGATGDGTDDLPHPVPGWNRRGSRSPRGLHGLHLGSPAETPHPVGSRSRGGDLSMARSNGAPFDTASSTPPPTTKATRYWR